jgi:hypothetical protein
VELTINYSKFEPNAGPEAEAAESAAVPGVVK